MVLPSLTWLILLQVILTFHHTSKVNISDNNLNFHYTGKSSDYQKLYEKQVFPLKYHKPKRNILKR